MRERVYCRWAWSLYTAVWAARWSRAAPRSSTPCRTSWRSTRPRRTAAARCTAAPSGSRGCPPAPPSGTTRACRACRPGPGRGGGSQRCDTPGWPSPRRSQPRGPSSERGGKETFYLTTHSTHFIYSYMEGRREGNVLFNDTLNTFSYGYMASDIWLRTTQIAREEPAAATHRLLFPISSKGSFICTIPQTG